MTSAEARWSHWRDSGCSCLAPVVMVITVTAGYASSLWTSHSSVHLTRLLVGRNQPPLVVTAAWPAECERLLSTFLNSELFGLLRFGGGSVEDIQFCFS